MQNQDEIKKEIKEFKQKIKEAEEEKNNILKKQEAIKNKITQEIDNNNDIPPNQKKQVIENRLKNDKEFKQMQEALAQIELKLKDLDALLKNRTEPEEIEVEAKDARMQSQPGKGEKYPNTVATGIQGVTILENKYTISYSTKGLKDTQRWLCQTDEERKKIVATVANLVEEKMKRGELKEPIPVNGTPEIVKLFYLEMKARNIKCEVDPKCSFQPIKQSPEAATVKIRHGKI